MSENISASFEDVARKTWISVIRTTSRYRNFIKLTPLVILFLIFVSWNWIVITVPAGHVAVKWWRFFGGTDISNVYSEGTHLDFPWDKMPIYDLRIQSINGTFDVLTSDGLMMTVEVTSRFRLNGATVGLLHKNVGPGYIETLVGPALATYVRAVLSQYPAEDAYGVKRLAIQEQIAKAMSADLEPRLPAGATPAAPWISIEQVLIRSMKFPQPVAAAINRKIEQLEVKQEYTYRLERERLESERKEVEAQGIAQFQTIVGSGITENYLRWKGVEATLALAQSQNAKIVVIGSPKDGMPLILGGLEGAAAAAPKLASSPAPPPALPAERTETGPRRPVPQ
jgi:regulator of protease activity HflC (stomatin/prohibitin superfamily)